MSDAEDPELLVGNEFAKLRVAVRRVGNGLRLEVADMVTGASVLLDPLELLGLALSEPDDRVPLIDPSRVARWRG